MRFFFGVIYCLFISSCNYLDFKKENKNTIVEKRLNEIRKNGLELYPEIRNCKGLDGKICFEKQLIDALSKGVSSLKNTNFYEATDTIWLSISVSNKGLLSLSKINSLPNNDIKHNIEETLQFLSPIKAGTINGTPVNCSFKIPLILKTTN